VHISVFLEGGPLHIVKIKRPSRLEVIEPFVVRGRIRVKQEILLAHLSVKILFVVHLGANLVVLSELVFYFTFVKVILVRQQQLLFSFGLFK